MGVPHAWSCNWVCVCCYFWSPLSGTLPFSAQSSTTPLSSPPPLHRCCHTISFTYMFTTHYNTLIFLHFFSFFSLRKRHRSCDSEEDQQLSPQAKRSGGGPSLLVSDLDSEVRLNWLIVFLRSFKSITQEQVYPLHQTVWWRSILQGRSNVQLGSFIVHPLTLMDILIDMRDPGLHILS